MSDLAALFPDLPAELLRDFDTRSGPGGVTTNGDRVDGVTDDDVVAYLQSVGSLRAPLKPLVEGQQAPPVPEFAYNGRIAPPANEAFIEPPDYGDAPPPAAPPPAEPAAPIPPSPEPLTPPAPPLPPQPAPLAPDPGQLPATPLQPPVPPVVPPTPGAPDATDGLATLGDILNRDPQLRQLIADYFTGRQAPPAPAPAYQPPVAPQQPQFVPQQQYLPPPPAAAWQPQPAPVTAVTPPLTFDEFTDPNLRALAEQNARLEARLNAQDQANQQFQAQAAAQAQQVQMRHFTTVVEGAVSQWGERYSIPPEILRDVRGVASRMGAAATYMNGVHPITGVPVVPDPAEATKIALDIAFHSTPSAIALEQQRTIARSQADQAHRDRLRGVGGSSASVPRNPPAPTDAAGRHNAMIDEVAAYMRGENPGN